MSRLIRDKTNKVSQIVLSLIVILIIPSCVSKETTEVATRSAVELPTQTEAQQPTPL
jgi:hypothetical protein